MHSLGNLNRFLRGNRHYYLLALIGVLAHALFSAAHPLFVRLAIDHVIGDNPLSGIQSRIANALGGIGLLRHSLWILPLVILGLTALQGAAQFLRTKAAALVGENSARNMRDRIYAHVLAQPYEYHVQTMTGDIIQRCSTDIEITRNFSANQSIEALAIIIQTTITLAAMLAMNARYTLLSTVALPLIMLSAMVFSRKMTVRFLAADEAEGLISETLQENLTGVRVVKAFAAQKLEIEKFEAVNNDYRAKSLKINRLFSNFWMFSDLICMAQYAAVIVVGTLWLTEGQISIGTLIAFIAYAGQIIWPMRGLGRILGYMGQAIVSVGRLQEILDSKPEDLSSGRDDVVLEGRIEFDRVSFAYDPDHPLLQDVSFVVPTGTTTAILGATGTGKSSLVHLLLRLYDYQEGSIRIDGVELNTINRSSLRSQIGIVLQEPFLFSRTIEENIRVSRQGATGEEVRQAAAIACVDEAIGEFDDGYQTLVGERGVTLSGGQRQRVAIARTLLRDVPILIFDDVLSAVDTETDAAIRHALRQRRRQSTTLIISHRVTTLAEADQILVMDEGRIVQRGTHEQLIREPGHYQRIWELQNKIDEAS